MKIIAQAGHLPVPHRSPFYDHSSINTKRKSKKLPLGCDSNLHSCRSSTRNSSTEHALGGEKINLHCGVATAVHNLSPLEFSYHSWHSLPQLVGLIMHHTDSQIKGDVLCYTRSVDFTVINCSPQYPFHHIAWQTMSIRKPVIGQFVNVISTTLPGHEPHKIYLATGLNTW